LRHSESGSSFVAGLEARVEFIVGSVNAKGQLVTPGTQFEAVSNTPDPTGSYTIFSWNTSDTATKGNGVVIYAVSKVQLESVAATGIVPPVFGYRLTSDPFGKPLIVAPTSTPPSARFAASTEHSLLGQVPLQAPTLLRTQVSTEKYSFPPDATQKPGPTPLGHEFQDPEGVIQADFNAEMEPTFTGGHIYAELDTGTASGFTCYAAFVGPNFGGCRWGDYSMGAVMNGRVYMSTEMVPQGFRDTLSNWGTFIWSAPPPTS
jgi:hypothetical protein